MDLEEETEGKQVIVGVCAMEKKTLSKPMKEILTRLEEFEYIKTCIFTEKVILEEPVEKWPLCDCLISFHSKGFPLEKSITYANLRKPLVINNLESQFAIQDRREVYRILSTAGIDLPRHAVLDRDLPPEEINFEEQDDSVIVNGIVFNKPFVEKPVDAEDHNIIIYYPASAGGGSQRLFRKIGSRSSVYSPESNVRTTGSYIYEDFMATDGTDVKVYTVGPDYAHAEARKSPALDGKVERNSEGKEVRYPVILSNKEKLIARKVCMAFNQTVCGFDLLRANGRSCVCDVNGFSFVKNSRKYYDDCSNILGNMILRELAPTLHIPWTIPFQLDDPPIVPTTVGKMMELRCVVAVVRHGDRTPKQKMKLEVKHPMFFDLFKRMNGYKVNHVKLKKPKHLQEVLDIARFLITEIEKGGSSNEVIEEKKSKLEQVRYILEMYGHFSGINRKVQLKYQPKGRPKSTSSEEEAHKEPSLLLVLKWGGELTPTGRVQAEELGKVFRCMYPGGQDLLIGGVPAHETQVDRYTRAASLPNGEYAGTQGLGLLRLHSTYRHDLKIYASDEGRVQMTAAAFAKGLLALEVKALPPTSTSVKNTAYTAKGGELTPILVQMVKSANTNGLLDNDCDSSKYQTLTRVKAKLHEMLQRDHEFSLEDEELLNPCNKISIAKALRFIRNPVKCCRYVYSLIQELNILIPQIQEESVGTQVLYHSETWDLMARRWGKLEKDFLPKTGVFDISKIPDIYDCIKYDVEHNRTVLENTDAWKVVVELYTNVQNLADVVIPQEYGMTRAEKLTIAQGICTPLLKKIKADLQRNIEDGEEKCEEEEDTVHRLNPRYSSGVSSPGRHVRTRLYFTSESHIHSLLTVLTHGGLVDGQDEQWMRALEYVSLVSELNYMTQIVIMLYEDPTKESTSDERFHVELHFSPGVNCCVQKDLPPGPGFRPHSRNHEQNGSQKNSFSTPSNHAESEDTDAGQDQQEPSQDPICSFKCSEKQVNALFENETVEKSVADPRTRKLSFRTERNLPPFQESDEAILKDQKLVKMEVQNKSVETSYIPTEPIKIKKISEITHPNNSDPIRPNKQEPTSNPSCPISIKISDLDGSSENISPGSETQRNIMSRSFEDSRPRSLEMSIAPPPGGRESPTNKDENTLASRSQSMEDGIDEDGFRRSHRLSLPGQRMTNYLKFLQELAVRQALGGAMSSQLFSTAVISGSSSSPNLGAANTPRDIGEDGTPTIRPLETLHNALSLRQIDTFLDHVTSANFKTPTHSPEKEEKMEL